MTDKARLEAEGNFEGLTEHRLRDAVADVAEELGLDTALTMLEEQYAELLRVKEREREPIAH